MKSCVSILLTLVIIIVFVGSACLLWYGSKTTTIEKAQEKPKAAEETETMDR